MPKCPYCKITFELSKDAEENERLYIKGDKKGYYTNRYYHKKCYELALNTPKEEWLPDLELNSRKTEDEIELEKWFINIYDLFTLDLKSTVDAARIKLQMKKIKTEHTNWTYKGMYFALRYHFLNKGGKVEKSNGGIGIVPFIYEEARAFWYAANVQHTNIVNEIEKQINERANRQERTFVKKKRGRKERTKYSLEDIANG